MKNFRKNIKSDFRNYEKYNSNEKKVIGSYYFSSYKGCFVIRTNTKRSGSYGILFISRNVNKFKVPEDVVRHDNMGEGRYYEKPWEITADILGGVCSRRHKECNIIKGNDYLKKWS